MTAKQPIIQESIADPFGGVVNVGDTVMVVTTGYSHRVNINKGKYIGYTLNGNVKKAKVEINSEVKEWFHKETKERFSWSKHGSFNQNNFDLKSTPYTWVTTLQLNRIASLK
jgi:hypothetical protein